jgi:hypothetical protein
MLPHLPRQLVSRHPGHHQVGQKEIEASGSFRNGERILAAFCEHGLVSDFTQGAIDELSHRRLIVYDQYPTACVEWGLGSGLEDGTDGLHHTSH